jgi:hypothetical protein
MATKFYFMADGKEYKYIGQRAGAGYYCWDCGLSLAAGGHDCVHQHNSHYLDKCAVCGIKPKTGIDSCSSFSWAISPGSFSDTNSAINTKIEDEYGREYSTEEFSDVLSKCPIKFFGDIGKDPI